MSNKADIRELILISGCSSLGDDIATKLSLQGDYDV